MILELNRIYNMDCLEGMRELPDKSVDLVLTDFPYGIDEKYSGYNDTQENLITLISKAIPEIRRISKVSLITVGTKNLFLYPKPDWTLAWVSTAGVGCGSWGFCCWHPILAYGKDPYLKNGMGSRPDIFVSNEMAPENNHPCPKPVFLWTDILLRGSVFESDVICDPFVGSGTTAVVAIRTGRRFIGFEKEPTYFDAAQIRIKKAQSQKKIEEWC
jgi:DNA modification methylase